MNQLSWVFVVAMLLLAGCMGPSDASEDANQEAVRAPLASFADCTVLASSATVPAIEDVGRTPAGWESSSLLALVHLTILSCDRVGVGDVEEEDAMVIFSSHGHFQAPADCVGPAASADLILHHAWASSEPLARNLENYLELAVDVVETSVLFGETADATTIDFSWRNENGESNVEFALIQSELDSKDSTELLFASLGADDEPRSLVSLTLDGRIPAVTSLQAIGETKEPEVGAEAGMPAWAGTTAVRTATFALLEANKLGGDPCASA